MKIPKLYLETSVWNFYYADDAPEKKEITIRFFDKIKADAYDIFISDIVLEEIGRANEEKRRLLLDVIRNHSPRRLTIGDYWFRTHRKQRPRSLHENIHQ